MLLREGSGLWSGLILRGVLGDTCDYLQGRHAGRQAGRRCRFFSASFVFRSEGRYLWAEERDTSAVGIEVFVSHGRTDAMKPRPSSFSHHLLFFLLRPPAFSFLPLLSSFFWPLTPPPPSALLPTSSQTGKRGEERKASDRREGKEGSGFTLSVCSVLSLFLTLHGSPPPCHPHSRRFFNRHPGGSRGVLGRAVIATASCVTCDMSFDTMATLFYIHLLLLLRGYILNVSQKIMCLCRVYSRRGLNSEVSGRPIFVF